MTLLIAGFCLTVLNCSKITSFSPKSFDGTTKASSLPDTHTMIFGAREPSYYCCNRLQQQAYLFALSSYITETDTQYAISFKNKLQLQFQKRPGLKTELEKWRRDPAIHWCGVTMLQIWLL